ncbi:ketosteroid isomerase-like protein [Paraburkholderia sp. BL6665CI2N2]|uniref:nuclear transport factor 2 family protein n=1 Tax=Paraburkholderia sp. BL6665CI2N2 TaxID=1938806 RepID=UPI001066F931|nr:nuclear transport factor 2 family protein [Paraburkholderia sp. BL6665CI2N2]TDY21648.1 ketosteroid isomerase-like protein [Paraburkholderia sp. BL6665CI2N2]
MSHPNANTNTNAHTNTELIQRFYTAFQQRDAETMVACYADDVVFSDPAFGELRGEEARDMWRMLVARAQDFSLTFEGVEADDRSGRAHWIASYLFSQTGRAVVNRIDARFVFRDGRIVEHRDSFDLWSWTRQALGLKGTLLGWSPLVQRAIRAQARKGLELYRRRQQRT